MTRGDRVYVNFDGRQWPFDSVYPDGRFGTVLELMNGGAIVKIDDGDGINAWIELAYLERIKIMSEPINLDDYEYMTPAQAAEAMRLKAEGQEVTALQSAMVAEIADRLVRNGDGTGTWAQWLADVELHRRTNGTVGQESEE